MMQAAQSLEVQLAALAAWETYIFGRLNTFKVRFYPCHDSESGLQRDVQGCPSALAGTRCGRLVVNCSV